MRVLVGSLLCVVIVAVVGLGWAFDRFFSHVSSGSSSDTIQLYRSVGNQLAVSLDQAADPAQLMASWPANGPISISIQSRENFPLPEELETDFNKGIPLTLESDDGISIFYLLRTHDQVLSLTPTDYNQNSGNPLKLIFTTAFYAGILLLLLIWLYPLISRLVKLQSAATDFGEGKLDRRINTNGLSYISDIESEFNRMAERIETLVADNKLLSSAVSHDLRTPLARLRFGIDTLEDTPDPEAKTRYIERISEDISEMEKLVNSLLEFAKLDHVLTGKKRVLINLSELMAECLAHQQENGESLTYEIQDNLYINGNSDYLAMLINNLVQNGLKYAESSVTVTLNQQGSRIVLSVDDDGPGIPVSERQNVLAPFTRADKVGQDGGQGSDLGSGLGGGHGLGLAIVNRIAQWHDATVEIDDAPRLKGARVQTFFAPP